MEKSDMVPGLRVSLVRDGGAQAPQVVDSADTAYAVIRAFIPVGDEREHFVAVYLDGRNNVKGVSVISIGTLNASLVHPREVFRPAIVAGAAAVIISHNHPSGDITPSVEDKDATVRLRKAGELLGIALLDHLIINDSGDKFSFKEHGLI